MICEHTVTMVPHETFGKSKVWDQWTGQNKKINRHKRKKKHVVTWKRPGGKESTKVRITLKIGKERGNSYQKREISLWKKAK